MISVIIPVYNGEATLGKLLASLKASDPTDHEVIVGDDGSTDGTRAVAAAYGVRLESTGGRRGPAVARNLGARVARGDIMLFLDADTTVPCHLLHHVATRFAAAPHLVAAVGYYDKIPLNPGAFARYKALMVHHWFRNAEVMESFETCCGAIRTRVFAAAGGFDESYTDADVEDYEFGYRVTAQGPIRVDHRLIVGHHFPAFGKNFRNYYRRARLWTVLFLRRRQFESTASTSGEAVSRLLGVGAVVLIGLGVAWRPLLAAGLALFAVYLTAIRAFLGLLRREEGLGFMVWGIGVHLASSLAIVLGAAASVCNHLLGRTRTTTAAGAKGRP